VMTLALAAPGGQLAGLAANGGGRYVVFGGGLPCWSVESTGDGEVVGGIGVSGGTAEQDVACVLLDLRMPGIDGLETAALIRKREIHKDLPILFVTSGEPTIEEQSLGYTLGAVDFVRRPLASDILKSKIRALVRLYDRLFTVENPGQVPDGRDWREFLTDEIGRIAERIKPGLELTDITTPNTDTVLVTLERGSI